MRICCAARAGRAPAVWLLFAVASAPASPRWAARPFVTDDARVVDPGACQLEAWTQQGPDGDQYWALPACNPTGWLELTAGTGVLSDAAGDRSPVVQLQGKTLFRALTPGGVGVGVAIGGMINGGELAQEDELGSVYAYVPIIDATYGRQLGVGREQEWLTVGFRALSTPFFTIGGGE